MANLLKNTTLHHIATLVKLGKVRRLNYHYSNQLAIYWFSMVAMQLATHNHRV